MKMYVAVPGDPNHYSFTGGILELEQTLSIPSHRCAAFENIRFTAIQEQSVVIGSIHRLLLQDSLAKTL